MQKQIALSDKWNELGKTIGGGENCGKLKKPHQSSILSIWKYKHNVARSFVLFKVSWKFMVFGFGFVLGGGSRKYTGFTSEEQIHFKNILSVQ